MKNSTLQFLANNDNVQHAWSDQLKSVLLDLNQNNKLAFEDQVRKNLFGIQQILLDLINSADSNVSEVSLFWTSTPDQANFVFTLKIGSESTNLVTAFTPYVIN